MSVRNDRERGAEYLAGARQLFGEATNEMRARRERVARAERESVPGRARQRASFASLVVAVPMLVLILTASIAGWSIESLFEPSLSPSAAHQELQQSLDELVADVNAFREDNKELPETLAQVGVPPRGTWTYTRLEDGRFTVRGALGDQHVSFTSVAGRRDDATPQPLDAEP